MTAQITTTLTIAAAIASALSIGLPVMASETVPSDTQVLAGIEDRQIEDWPWGVGGEYSETLETENLYQRQTRYPMFLDSVKVRKANEVNSDVGDLERTTGRFPFAEF